MLNIFCHVFFQLSRNVCLANPPITYALFCVSHFSKWYDLLYCSVRQVFFFLTIVWWNKYSKNRLKDREALQYLHTNLFWGIENISLKEFQSEFCLQVYTKLIHSLGIIIISIEIEKIQDNFFFPRLIRWKHLY